MTADSLRELLGEWQEPEYRAGQILEWIYSKDARGFEDMTNLPKALRARLSAESVLFESAPAAEQRSSDGTIKLLLRWADGTATECVMIPDGGRRTACISTQVGCPVECVFCASGINGLRRQLTAGQIVEQVMRVRRLCVGDARLSNVVLMGSGEPLLNYDNTLCAANTIIAPWGVGIGARKVTLSTVGVEKQIRRLADERLQITLALSLHAPTDELRRRIIPHTFGTTVESLVDACRYYFERTGRETTIEYVLLKGLNDQAHHAGKLAALVRKMRGNVNLLRYNPVENLPYARPGSAEAHAFLEVLRAAGVNAHIRKSRGLDIDSACGQLQNRTTRGPSLYGSPVASAVRVRIPTPIHREDD